MKRLRIKLPAGIAIFGIATLAYGLTIVPSFDSSITNDPNGPAMVTAINAAIQTLQTNLAGNFTVYIHYTNDPTAGLGESDTWGNTYSYPAYLAALKSSAADANDTNAISKLPNSPTDPVIGGLNIYLTLPLARHLGLDSGVGPDGFDSTIHLNMALMNLTRPPADPDNYDLISVVEHEDDEVLGTSSGLPITNFIWAMDLFRYTTNLARTFTTNGDNAYFSVDGTNLWARFNMDPDGDYGDFWSANGELWAPPGIPPHEQVQDAFAYNGTVRDLGPNEMAMLDAVGWTLVSPAPKLAPRLWIAPDGTGKITLGWPVSSTGYTLQERTNLVSGSWTASATGTNNPAVITVTAKPKFYQLYNPNPPVVSEVVQSETIAVPPKSTNSLQLITRIFRPGQP